MDKPPKKEGFALQLLGPLSQGSLGKPAWVARHPGWLMISSGWYEIFFFLSMGSSRMIIIYCPLKLDYQLQSIGLWGMIRMIRIHCLQTLPQHCCTGAPWTCGGNAPHPALRTSPMWSWRGAVHLTKSRGFGDWCWEFHMIFQWRWRFTSTDGLKVGIYHDLPVEDVNLSEFAYWGWGFSYWTWGSQEKFGIIRVNLEHL